jgi:hypothetical protein
LATTPSLSLSVSQSRKEVDAFGDTTQPLQIDNKSINMPAETRFSIPQRGWTMAQSDFYGYLFQNDKKPTKVLDALLRGIANYIVRPPCEKAQWMRQR